MVLNNSISREAKAGSRIIHLARVGMPHSIITKALETPQPKELIFRYQFPRNL
jgi:hypothetical protein